jgi:hypothetical protein
MLQGVGGVPRPAQAGHGPRGHALGDVGARKRAERRDEALGQHEDARARRDPLAMGGHGGRQGAGGDGEADHVRAREVQPRRAPDRDRLRQRDPGQVVLVLAGLAQGRRLLAGPAAQLDVQAGARERDREARPPGAGADDRGAAQRRGAAEPLPLQRHARPDPLGDGARELG